MTWFYNLKIGTKLIGAFLVMSVLTAAVGYLGLTRMATINQMANQLYERELLGLSYAKEANIGLIYMGRAEKNLLLATNDEQRRQSKLIWDKAQKEVLTNIEQARELFVTDEGRQLLAQIDQAWREYDSVHTRIIELAMEEDFQQDRASLTMSLNAGRETSDAIDNLMTDLANRKEVEAQIAAVATDELYAASQAFMIGVIVGSIVLGIALGLFISRAITAPIRQLVHVAGQLAKGDLSTDVTIDTKEEMGALAGAFRQIKDVVGGLSDEVGKVASWAKEGQLAKRGDASSFEGAYATLVSRLNDALDSMLEPINESAAVLDRVARRDLSTRVEGDYRGDHAKIKESLNEALDNLEDALNQASMGAEQVSSASTQISNGSQQLAQSASEQASSLEEISSSLEEMTSMTSQMAENSNQGKTLASQAQGSAERGNEAMQRMAAAINKIKESSDDTAKIVKTIDEIAFQTNLLALNAAVEAARAGEAGKGFAVVAEEVRNLAQRSAEAAKNTAQLIEESVQNAEGGVQISTEVAQVLAEITDGSCKVRDLVAEIAAAGNEQAKGIQQVNAAVTQLDKATQQNAANSEESASAAEELNSQSLSLSQTVAQFQLSRGPSRKAEATIKPPRIGSNGHSTAVKPVAKNGNGAAHRELVAASNGNGNGSNGSRFSSEMLIPLDDEDFKDF